MVPLRRMAFTIAPAALAIAVANAPSAAAQEPAPAAEAPAAPVLKVRAEAIYPPGALSDGLEGTVGLEVVVDERGDVESARVVSPAGHGFDEAAIEAARKFTFEPARLAGKAIRSAVQVSYEFHLPSPREPASAPTPALSVHVARPAAARQAPLHGADRPAATAPTPSESPPDEDLPRSRTKW